MSKDSGSIGTSGPSELAQISPAPRLPLRLGQLVATPGALEAALLAGDNLGAYLSRHARGDWGDLSPDDAQANDLASRTDERVFSAYVLSNGTKIWIITEADRSSTCVLLPDEY